MLRGFYTCTLLLMLLASSPAQEALTNESIVKLVKAGLAEDTIVSLIKAQPAKFSLSADNLIALKSAGVTDDVLAAMIAIVYHAGVL